jgi:hypothetical protein
MVGLAERCQIADLGVAIDSALIAAFAASNSLLMLTM